MQLSKVSSNNLISLRQTRLVPLLIQRGSRGRHKCSRSQSWKPPAVFLTPTHFPGGLPWRSLPRYDSPQFPQRQGSTSSKYKHSSQTDAGERRRINIEYERLLVYEVTLRTKKSRRGEIYAAMAAFEEPLINARRARRTFLHRKCLWCS